MKYGLDKIAGMVLDHQDDPGFVWENEILPFWPEDLDTPDIGTTMSKEACVAHFDGMSRYPTDTPENTLASSMYFLRFGVDRMTDMDEIVKVASDLKAYRQIHGVSIPIEFIGYVSERPWEQQEEVEEYYADSDGNLPITTPEQTTQSIDVFEKNASLWPASDRIYIAQSLQEAADFHGVSAHIKEASYSQMSDHVAGAIQLRLTAMESMKDQIRAQHGDDFDKSFFDTYEMAIGSVFDDNDDPVKIASLIEELDNNYGLSDGWGTLFPDPIESVFVGVDPFAGFTKKASYDGVDFDGLRDTLDSYIVDAIKENPSVVIPTLPGPQKEIVEDYLNSKRK